MLLAIHGNLFFKRRSKVILSRFILLCSRCVDAADAAAAAASCCNAVDDSLPVHCDWAALMPLLSFFPPPPFLLLLPIPLYYCCCSCCLSLWFMALTSSFLVTKGIALASSTSSSVPSLAIYSRRDACYSCELLLLIAGSILMCGMYRRHHVVL